MNNDPQDKSKELTEEEKFEKAIKFKDQKKEDRRKRRKDKMEMMDVIEEGKEIEFVQED